MKQKQTIKMNESQLRDIIKESIENVLNGEGASETSLEEGFFGNMVQGAKSMYQQGQQVNQRQQTQQQLQQYLSQFNKYLQPT